MLKIFKEQTMDKKKHQSQPGKNQFQSHLEKIQKIKTFQQIKT